MHWRASEDKWRIVIDWPQSLWFAAYIGQREGFELGGEIQASSQAETEWRIWWDNCDMPVYELAAVEKLREFYKAGFEQEVAETRLKLVQKQNTQLDLVNLAKIVKSCQIKMGKTVSDFELELDFVTWPKDYNKSVSNRRIVLGIGYLQPEKLAELNEILQRLILGLV